VRSLKPEACPANALSPIRLQSEMADATRAMRAGQVAIARKDVATAVLMVASARTQLGLIYERYQAPSLERERALLRGADMDLAALQNNLRAGDAMGAMRLALWPDQASALSRKLQPGEDRSLFAPRPLAAAMRATQ
jgi:hypothetical protein